jgi:hypothetical protein
MVATFVKISDSHIDRMAQTYCDKTWHVHVVLPANIHSGEAFQVSLTPCNCAAPAHAPATGPAMGEKSGPADHPQPNFTSIPKP